MLPGIDQTMSSHRTAWRSRHSWPVALFVLAATMLLTLSVYISYRSEPALYHPVLDRQHFQAVGLPQRTLAEVVESQSESQDQSRSTPVENQNRHDRPHSPSSAATEPAQAPLENIQSPAPVASQSPMSPPSSLPISSDVEVSKHHVTFNNVCFRKGYWDPVKLVGVHGLMQLFNVHPLKEAQIRKEYINQLSPQWQLKYEFVHQPFPNPTATMFKGNTFFYTLAEDNIAQFYQELACHMPVLLNQEYRHSVGYDSHHWSHFYAPNIAFSKPAANLTWCPAQLKWLVGATQDLQPSVQLSVHDFEEIEPLARKLTDLNTPIGCFDSITIYQAGSCHLLQGPYPEGTNDTYAHIMRYTKKQLQLAESRPCASSVVIYDRFNAIRRRLMNGADLKKFIENKLKHRPNTKPVTIQHLQSLPDNIVDQAKLYNDADVFIEPHSASNYNAWFMHDNSAHLEIGEHGSWFGSGMAPYITTGLFYKRYDFGWDLLPWDPKFDNLEFPGERSFRATPELMEAIWADISPRFCNITG